MHIIGTERRAQVMPTRSILNNMSHGENISASLGEPEFVAQLFFEIPA
jgi:hypothetical protein